jgi:hypothetical protein
MNRILQNPYRVLGLLSNSSERELQKQKTTISRYADVGKVKTFDYDFPALGDLTRTAVSVQDAAGQLEQPKNKVLHAMFWFINHSPLDEIALNNLKEGNLDKACDIWQKAIKGDQVSDRNISALSNLSTVLLAVAIKDGAIDLPKFNQAVDLKGRLINSDCFEGFALIITGEDVLTSNEVLSRYLVDEIADITRPYLNRSSGISTLKLIQSFKSYPLASKQHLISNLSEKHIKIIEQEIAEAESKREDDASDAEVYAAKLYNTTKPHLLLLKNILGEENSQNQLFANKVAEELLQCAIDFFKEFQDSDEYDPGQSVMEVMQMAEAVGPSGQVMNRLEENLENLQEWIDDAPNRVRNRKIKEELDFITAKLDTFQNASSTVINAKAIVTDCKAKLQNMKTVMGASDELYLQVSSAVANNAMGMLVAFINQQQEAIQNHKIALITLTQHTAAALSVMKQLIAFDVLTETRSRIQKNHTDLKNLHSAFVTMKKRELSDAQAEMARIMEWTFGRSSEAKANQIRLQNSKISGLTQELQTLQAALA